MQGNPGVTTFRHSGRDQIYAFVNGGNGRLVVCFWNADPRITSWQWADEGQPQGARVDSSPTTITSVQNENVPEHFLHAFVRGDDGHLRERFWNGVQWVDWVDHGQPVWNVLVTLSPGVATFRATFGEGDDRLTDAADRLFVFVWGDDERLYRFLHRDGMWRFQGELPNRARVISEPAVIKLPPQPLLEAVYAYVVGNDGHLYVNFTTDMTGNNWDWRDLGQPDQNTTVAGGFMRPGLVLFANRVQSFVCGSDGTLWVCSWLRQQAQQWTSLGMPANANPVASMASIVTHTPLGEGVEFAYAFVRSNNNHLYMCRWDGGSDVRWNDLGRPSTGGHDVIALPAVGNTGVSSAPGAVTFTFYQPISTGTVERTDRIYVFVLGADGHLHVCYWSGLEIDTWLWTDLLTPR